MRVIECSCGATLQAANDDDLANRLREHFAEAHPEEMRLPDVELDDRRFQDLVSQKAYSASDS
jgi:hypothetical protein